MTNIPAVKICTTSRCQLRCCGCSVEAWRDKNPCYEMSIDEVIDFVDACRASGYKIGQIIISGGEPMLWRHLVHGACLLRPIADKMSMFSNGIAALSRIDEVRKASEFFDEIRVSADEHNINAVTALRNGGLNCKVKIKDKSEFRLRPRAAVTGVLPAKCRCPHIELCDGRLYACALLLSGSVADGVDVPDDMNTDVSPGFMDRLDTANVTSMPMCAKCESNMRIKPERVARL